MTNVFKNERGSCFSKLKKAVGASGITLIPMKIYPDSAHGFLFQHHTEFAADVNSFLD